MIIVKDSKFIIQPKRLFMSTRPFEELLTNSEKDVGFGKDTLPSMRQMMEAPMGRYISDLST